MSAVTVWLGLETCFRTIDGLTNIMLGEPTAIHETPALIGMYGSLEVQLRSSPPARNLNGIDHVFALRLAIKWQDNPQAEMQLLTLIGQIPAVIAADPHLGGRVNNGMARVSAAITGFAEYGSEKFRVADYTCMVLEKETAT